MEQLEILLKTIKDSGFWQRLFGWRKVKECIREAQTMLQGIKVRYEDQAFQFNEANRALSDSRRELESLRSQLLNSEKTQSRNGPL